MLFKVTVTCKDDPEAQLSSGVSLQFLVQYEEEAALSRAIRFLCPDAIFLIEEAHGNVVFSISPLSLFIRV